MVKMGGTNVSRPGVVPVTPQAKGVSSLKTTRRADPLASVSAIEALLENLCTPLPHLILRSQKSLFSSLNFGIWPLFLGSVEGNRGWPSRLTRE